MRIIGVVETIPLLRDKQKSGYLKVSFGKKYKSFSDNTQRYLLSRKQFHERTS